jgi:ClpP class serine protease
LTNEEAAQIDEYRKQQEEYVEKWRQVMGMVRKNFKRKVQEKRRF